MSFLDNLFESAKKVVFKKDVERLTETYHHFLNVLEVYPRTTATEAKEDKLMENIVRFGEWDNQLADLIVRRMANQDSRKIVLDDKTRMMIVEESRRLYVWDVTTQYIVELWTDYGFGQRPDIVPRDNNLKVVWDSFWHNPQNQFLLNERKINELSNKLQVDGEYWFVQFISTLDGTSTLRIIETDDIKEIYHDRDDDAVPIYYKRQWLSGRYNTEEHELFYRDYRATEEQAQRAKAEILEENKEAQFAEDINENTDVQVFHVKFREIEGRGWPFLTAGFAWSRGYKGFLEDRATINKAAAAVVEKVKVQGGQRMVDAVKSRLQSSITQGSNKTERNPPPATGSIWVENQQLDREWMNRPTNAADAEKDGIAILAQTALAGKLYPHYLGRGEYYRLATATAMEGPTFRSFNRYQGFWSSIWRTLVEMIAEGMEKHGGMTFGTVEADVNTDRIIDTDVSEIDEIMDSINGSVDAGTVDPEVAKRAQLSLIRMALQTIGTPNIVDVVGTTTTELEEALETGGFAEYARRIRGLIYGLWSGQLDEAGFAESMDILIETGLSRAWRDGMREVGLSWDEMTVEEQVALSEIVTEQVSHITGLAEYVGRKNKESGYLLRETDYRAELWANAYQKAYNKALQMAQNDPKLEWELGQTEESCVPEGTKINTENGDVDIENILVGDKVLTREGYKRVTKTHKNIYNGEMIEIVTPNGKLIATENHPIMTQRGWVDAGDLRLDDVVLFKD